MIDYPDISDGAGLRDFQLLNRVQHLAIQTRVDLQIARPVEYFLLRFRQQFRLLIDAVFCGIQRLDLFVKCLDRGMFRRETL